MKSDRQIKSDIVAELLWEPGIRTQDVGVVVREGVVTLAGTVPTYLEKIATAQVIRRVSGVRGLAEGLKVNPKGIYQKNDTEIARDLANALDGSVLVPLGRVKNTVEDGWVTLSGHVPWKFQREAAYNAVRHLKGVKCVVNQIVVKPSLVSRTPLKAKMKVALKRKPAQRTPVGAAN